MAEKYKIKKVTDFPEASTLDGFYAFGTDGSNNSVKVPIGMLRGNSPHIGANGNWFVGDIDLGVHAQGEPGEVSQADLTARTAPIIQNQTLARVGGYYYNNNGVLLAIPTQNYLVVSELIIIDGGDITVKNAQALAGANGMYIFFFNKNGVFLSGISGTSGEVYSFTFNRTNYPATPTDSYYVAFNGSIGQAKDIEISVKLNQIYAGYIVAQNLNILDSRINNYNVGTSEHPYIPAGRNLLVNYFDGYTTSTGTIAQPATSSYCAYSNLMRIKGGKKYRYTGFIPNNYVRGIVWYDKKGKFISVVSVTADTYTLDVTAPDNAYYCRCTCQKSKLKDFAFTALEDIDLSEETLTFNAPEVVYTVDNTAAMVSAGDRNTSQPVAYLYADRLYKELTEGLLDDVNYKIPFYNRALNGISNIDSTTETKTQTLPVNLVSKGYKDNSANTIIRITNNTALLNNRVLLQCIGDSMTNLGYYPSYIRRLILQNNIDYKARKGITDDLIDCKTVGSVRINKNESFTYNGTTVNVTNWAEGRSGTTTASLLRHADWYGWNLANALPIAWDALGLSTSNGAYTGTTSQKELIRTTCSGVYTPVASSYTWDRYKSYIGYGSVAWADATTAQKNELVSYMDGSRSAGNLLDSPINPFFDRDTVSSSSYAYGFNWAKYYDRYKTHEDDGVTELSVKGSNAVTGSLVCHPNYIVFNMGTNDDIYGASTALKMTDLQQVLNLLKAQTTATILFFQNGFTWSKNPTVIDEALQIGLYERSGFDGFDKNQIMQSWIKTKNDSRILYNPAFFCQGYGSIESRATDLGIPIVVDDVHPTVKAFYQWAYQLYSQIVYTLAVKNNS